LHHYRVNGNARFNNDFGRSCSKPTIVKETVRTQG